MDSGVHRRAHRWLWRVGGVARALEVAAERHGPGHPLSLCLSPKPPRAAQEPPMSRPSPPRAAQGRPRATRRAPARRRPAKTAPGRCQEGASDCAARASEDVGGRHPHAYRQRGVGGHALMLHLVRVRVRVRVRVKVRVKVRVSVRVGVRVSCPTKRGSPASLNTAIASSIRRSRAWLG